MTNMSFFPSPLRCLSAFLAKSLFSSDSSLVCANCPGTLYLLFRQVAVTGNPPTPSLRRNPSGRMLSVWRAQLTKWVDPSVVSLLIPR